MKRAYLHILLLSLFIIGCDIDNELAVCRYNGRMEFWYLKDGKENVLPEYIYTMTDYIFDSRQVLLQVGKRFIRDDLIHKDLNLPPGQYTLVSWANIDSAYQAFPVVVGETRLNEMMLYLNNPADTKAKAPVSKADGFHKNGDKLYFGTVEFEVERSGVTRKRIEMTHSHCLLNITVKWKHNAPSDRLAYHFELKDVPGAYGFRSDFQVRNEWLDSYAPIFYSIPEQRPMSVNHRLDATMGITRSVKGTFVTCRLTNNSHPLLCLYGNGRSVMKELDLHTYFRTMQIDLDKNLRQEFSLVAEIQPDGTVLLSPAVVSDWENGGAIGGSI